MRCKHIHSNCTEAHSRMQVLATLGCAALQQPSRLLQHRSKQQRSSHRMRLPSSLGLLHLPKAPASQASRLMISRRRRRLLQSWMHQPFRRPHKRQPLSLSLQSTFLQRRPLRQQQRPSTRWRRCSALSSHKRTPRRLPRSRSSRPRRNRPRSRPRSRSRSHDCQCRSRAEQQTRPASPAPAPTQSGPRRWPPSTAPRRHLRRAKRRSRSTCSRPPPVVSHPRKPPPPPVSCRRRPARQCCLPRSPRRLQPHKSQQPQEELREAQLRLPSCHRLLQPRHLHWCFHRRHQL